MAQPTPLPSYDDVSAYHRVSGITPGVALVEINRPSKLNAYTQPMWLELRAIFDRLSSDSDVRVVIFTGAGDRAFTAGLDVQAAAQDPILQGKVGDDPARKSVAVRRHVAEFQDCISAVERCEKPVIAILHGICYGLAIDLATATDIRIVAENARLAVKEVDIGMAADIGTLSRLPRIAGGTTSWVKEVCLTAREFSASEAHRNGLVSTVCSDKAQAMAEAQRLASLIASKSPVATQGTKELLNHGRDRSLQDSLRYTGVWNSAMLQTGDLQSALMSGLQKTKPTFAKL